MKEPTPSPPAAMQPLPEGMLNGLVLPGSSGEAAEHIQTHISHLFLTRDRVYKIRKAVRLPFLDFSRRAERNRDCIDEVKLNRRLSPDVYLGVAAIQPSGDRWQIGPPREHLEHGSDEGGLEHCVIMRRLPDGGDAQAMLERGELTYAHLDAVAHRLSDFHRAHRLEFPGHFSESAWLDHVANPIMQTLALIREGNDAADVQERAKALAAVTRNGLEKHAAQIRARHRDGLSVDGHGDLQLGHVWFEADRTSPLIIDCTEFNRGFRTIDAANEVAFLAMDLHYRGHPKFAAHFLARYARETDDFGLFRVVDLYSSSRAAVRANVAFLAARDPAIEPSQRAAALTSAHDHLTTAEALLDPRPHAAVFVACGIVGSGKSTVAEFLADALSAVSIASDRTRKHIAGLRPEDHRGAGHEAETGLYDPSQTDSVYLGLLERADAVITSGRCVILDATFALASQRLAVLDWASLRKLPAYLIEARCDPEVTIERLRRRQSEASDPSDAGPSLYRWSVDRFEATDEWPSENRAQIQTDSASWAAELRRLPFVRRQQARLSRSAPTWPGPS